MSNVNHWLFEPSKKPKEEHYLRKTERECFRSVCDWCLSLKRRVDTQTIADDLQKSKGTTNKCLKVLQDKGLIDYKRGAQGGWGPTEYGTRSATWKSALASWERKNRQR